MTKFLVVAHETGLSVELLEAIRGVGEAQPGATFDVVVPSTPVEHLLTWEEGETRAVALQHAAEISHRLGDCGVAVGHVGIGDSHPVAAIEDELRRHPGAYDGLIIATHPPGISRWLKLDLVTRAESLGLPTTHVVVHSVAAACGPTARVQSAS